MCVFCSQRGRSPDHGPDSIAPEPFGSFPLEPETIRLVVNNDDSAPDSISTTNSMDVGDTFQGQIDYDGDEDWIAIDLTAGQSVLIELSGLDDNRIAVYRPGGGLVAILLEDSYTLEVSETGTHYIKAEIVFSFTSTGSYTLTTTDVTPFPPTLTAPMRSIDWGTELSSNTVSYYFAPAGYSYSDPFDNITAESWNAYERAQIRKAMDLIETQVDLTFVETNSTSADFILIADSNEITDLGFFNPPDTNNAGSGVFGVDDWDRSAGGDLEMGGFSFATVTHELLHGLGLAHPHDRGGSSSTMTGVSSEYDDTGIHQLNQGVFTAMTYNGGFYEGPVGTYSPSLTYGFDAGPMALDIAVLQRKYGANMTTAAGDDIYALPEANQIGTSYQAIWDTGGDDTLRYTGTRDTTLDLRAATLENAEGGGGYISAATNIAGGYTIAYGVVIENAESGAGDDALHGNDTANHLMAGAGNDTIAAYKGNDTIEAGDGADDVQGLGGNDSILGGAGNDTLRGGRENDTINGGDGNDQLRGQREGDLIEGGNGFDNIKGGGGNDILRGGNGNDFLKGGTRRDEIEGGGGNDTLQGNSFDDTLTGGFGDDSLNAGGDNDTLTGSEGNDTLKGGGGYDTFIFDLGHNSDLVLDLDLNRDRLHFTAALADGQDAQGIEDAATLLGGDVIVDFGDGDMITFQGLGTTDGLADIISII